MFYLSLLLIFIALWFLFSLPFSLFFLSLLSLIIVICSIHWFHQSHLSFHFFFSLLLCLIFSLTLSLILFLSLSRSLILPLSLLLPFLFSYLLFSSSNLFGPFCSCQNTFTSFPPFLCMQNLFLFSKLCSIFNPAGSIVYLNSFLYFPFTSSLSLSLPSLLTSFAAIYIFFVIFTNLFFPLVFIFFFKFSKLLHFQKISFHIHFVSFVTFETFFSLSLSPSHLILEIIFPQTSSFLQQFFCAQKNWKTKKIIEIIWKFHIFNDFHILKF